MGIANRIHDTLLEWRLEWSEALKGWLINSIRFGIETLMDILGKAFAPVLKPFIEKMEESGEIPPELQPLLNEIKAPSGQIASMLAMSLGGSVMSGATGSFMQIAFARFGYWIGRLLHPLLPSDKELISSWLRGNITDDNLLYYLRSLGYDDLAITTIKDLSHPRLDVNTVMKLWLRNKELYEPVMKDLADQGLDPARISFLKELTNWIPTADEQTHWLAREVYEPNMVERYGLNDELPNYEETDFSKVGVTPEQMSNKWKAHWEHASYMQIREMLRRGVLNLDKTMPSPPTTEAGWEARDKEGIQAMFDWYRLVEIPPFWRDRLTEMAFEVPTRVDVRRFWDMRTIDEERLRSIYHAQGYHGKDLDDYILWTKVYVAFPDLIARYKNGWIAEETVKSELAALGMSPERLEEMWQTKFKTAQPERVAAEKSATATEIMKAVKKELITRSEGVERLGRLGYSPEEAEFKLDVYIGVSEGSPDTYAEFIDLTEKYRKAMGLDAQLPPPDLVEASKAVRHAKVDLTDAEAKGVKGEKLGSFIKAVSDTEYRYRQLLISWEQSKKGGL